MLYKNPLYKKVRNAYPLEVSCGHCKTSVAMYAKVGKGNLIKMNITRVIESKVDIANNEGHLLCPNCQNKIARKGVYNGRTTYWIVRGKINTKRLDNYRM